MDWAQILVIILAVLFAVFLALAIVLALLVLSLTRQIKAAAASAERTVAAMEGAVTQFNKAALPLAIVKGIIKQVNKTTTRKKGRREDE